MQALHAIYDNYNGLHTNAYDEAITTPTEESVRRATAFQLIVNKELGLAKNENPLQGSFILEELTDLVEEAVLTEFDRITERGGVLGAMEDHVPVPRDPGGKPLPRNAQAHQRIPHHRREHLPQLEGLTDGIAEGSDPRDGGGEGGADPDGGECAAGLCRRREGSASETSGGRDPRNENMFAVLMEATKYCSLGQLTAAMFEVGGQYRRNM